MFVIGSHLSISKGFEAIGRQAVLIGANTFQFFTRNPRGGSARKIEQGDVDALIKIMQENNMPVILAHAPYTMNLCSANADTRKFAIDTLSDDLQRMEYLPGNLYNFHPGSHIGQGVEKGIEQISEALNKALTPEIHSTVLLETMAGKGSEIGSRFEELAEIISRVELNGKMGVCFDTCHVFDAGYDIVNRLDEVLEEFDNIIGLHKLKAVHLNDSMNYLGCRKDRHEKMGKGAIGINAFEKIINHPSLKNLPFFLETPNDIQGYADEIKTLRNLYIN